MKVIVFHASYGCETGCCGHIVQVGDDERFAHDHPGTLQNPGESDREFAERIVTEQFGAEHVADLDWENCVVSDD